MTTQEDNQHFIVVALAQNKPGVLNRTLSMFRRRRFNVESITAGHTHVPGLSRFTIVVSGSKNILDQVVKQMYKVLEITKVMEVSSDSAVTRDLALIKVSATKATRSEIIQLVDIFRAKIVDVAHNSFIIEITGDEDKIDSFIDIIRKFGIKESVRTGVTAMKRGDAEMKTDK